MRFAIGTWSPVHVAITPTMHILVEPRRHLLSQPSSTYHLTCRRTRRSKARHYVITFCVLDTPDGPPTKFVLKQKGAHGLPNDSLRTAGQFRSAIV